MTSHDIDISFGLSYWGLWDIDISSCSAGVRTWDVSAMAAKRKATVKSEDQERRGLRFFPFQ